MCFELNVIQHSEYLNISWYLHEMALNDNHMCVPWSHATKSTMLYNSNKYKWFDEYIYIGPKMNTRQTPNESI